MFERGLAGLCVFGVLMAGALGAFGQDGGLTARERELLEAVGRLEKRVADLESQVKELKGAPVAPGVGVAPAPAPAAAEPGVAAPVEIEERVTKLEEESKEDFRVFWKDGLRFESRDGDFKMRLGGRIFYDMAWFDQDGRLENSLGDEQDGVGFRTARINLQGDIYRDFFFRFEYDLAGEKGPSGFTDTYMGVRNVPYAGRLTLGHFKEPFGLEELTNTSYTTFMELALPSAFDPARNAGVMLNNTLGETGAEWLTWAVGAFRNTDNWPSVDDSDEDQGWAVTGRVTGLPWYAEKGRKLLHLGAAYSHRNPDGATINRYQIQPISEARLAAFRWVTTEGFPRFRLQDARADDVDLFGAESALVLGPFSVQGEYTHARVETTFDSTEDFDGFYVLASYFLTGESRAYEPGIGTFGRVRPARDFTLRGGPGAWEVAARFSRIDLNSGGVRGGRQDNITVGLNWYLNANMRWMVNYVLADIEHDLYSGDMDILQTRFQVDF